MAQKSKQLDPRFTDFDEFADQLSGMLDELDIRQQRRKTAPLKEKPIVAKRFYIELRILLRMLVKSQFDCIAALNYQNDFPIFRSPGEQIDYGESRHTIPLPIYTKYKPALLLYFTLIRFKLCECSLDKKVQSIMIPLYEEVRLHINKSLQEILSRIYQQAERQVHKHGKGNIRINEDVKLLLMEADRPSMRWYRPGRTFMCKCGWKGLIPIIAVRGGFRGSLKHICPICMYEVR